MEQTSLLPRMLTLELITGDLQPCPWSTFQEELKDFLEAGTLIDRREEQKTLTVALLDSRSGIDQHGAFWSQWLSLSQGCKALVISTATTPAMHMQIWPSRIAPINVEMRRDQCVAKETHYVFNYRRIN